MAFFAICDIVAPTDTKINAAHLNFWNVPNGIDACALFDGFVGKSVFFDVGLRIKCGTQPFSEFGLLLPFGTRDDAFVDLSEKLWIKETAELIFGRSVTHGAGSKIIYDGSSVYEELISDEIVTLPRGSVVRDAALSNEKFSFWRIKLPRVIACDEGIYLRFRFKLTDWSHVFRSKGWAFARRGFTFDFRLYDVREVVGLPEWQPLIPKLKKIYKCNVFAIVESSYFCRTASPDIYYMRLLEGEVWKPYLEPPVGKSNLKKLAIFQWRAPVNQLGSSNTGENDHIDVSKPFRVYLDITREFGSSLLFSYGLASIAIGTTVAITSELVRLLFL